MSASVMFKRLSSQFSTRQSVDLSTFNSSDICESLGSGKFYKKGSSFRNWKLRRYEVYAIGM